MFRDDVCAMGLVHFAKQRTHPHMYVQNTPQPCFQSTTLRIMTISIKAKVVVRFHCSEMMYVDLRAKKL